MISDILSDAVYQMDYYLKKGWYEEPELTKIIKVRAAMDDLRAELDRCPGQDEKEGEK